jgi:hypothetical protein
MDIASQIAAGVGALGQSRANLDARNANRGGGGGGPALDPIQVLQAQIALENQQENLNQKKLAEQEYKDNRKAQQQVLLQTMMQQREREAAQQQWVQRFEMESKALMDAKAESEASALRLAADQARLDEAAASREKEQMLKYQAKKQTAMNSLLDMQRKANQSAEAFATSWQVASDMLAATHKSVFGFRETMAPQIKTAANALLSMHRVGSFDRSRTEKDAAFDSIGGVLSTFVEDASEEDRAKIRGMVETMIRTAPDLEKNKHSREQFSAAREGLAAMVGPAGMLALSDIAEGAAGQLDDLMAAASQNNTVNKTREQFWNEGQIRSLSTVLKSTFGKGMAEWDDVQEMQTAYLNQVAAVVADPDLDDTQRRARIDTMTSSFVKSMSRGFQLTEEQAAELEGAFTVAVSRALPIDKAVRLLEDKQIEVQIDLEGTAAATMFDAETAGLRDLTQIVERFARENRQKRGTDAETPGPKENTTGLDSGQAGANGPVA